MKKIAEAPRVHKDLRVKTYSKDLNDKLDRIERMLKWIILHYLDVPQNVDLPDISDILEEKK